MMRLEKYSFDIEEVKWPRQGGPSKTDRVGRLVPDIKNGQFFIPSVVNHPDLGLAIWSYDEETESITWRALQGQTSLRQETKDKGQGWRLIGPIKRKDEQNEVYDLTAAFLEEIQFFPFGKHDDLVDAISRVHDMEPVGAMIQKAKDVVPPVYVDGA